MTRSSKLGFVFREAPVKSGILLLSSLPVGTSVLRGLSGVNERDETQFALLVILGIRLKLIIQITNCFLNYELDFLIFNINEIHLGSRK